MPNYSDLWSRALELMTEYYSKTTISTWFDDAALSELRGNRIIITTPQRIKKDVINERYLAKLRETWRDIFSDDMEVEVLTDEEFRLYLLEREKSDPTGADEYTFDNFVVGNSNRFAHAAAIAVAEKPAQAYNPLFIYGPSGVGKTHILYAIAHEIKRNHPDWKVVYKTSEIFINEMVAALSQGKMNDFREYRSADMLLIDDVQFLSGKVSLQEEFFHTFNAISGARHQIVLTSDRPPREIPKLEDRICNRFESGLLADINAPDYETRSAIIQKKAEYLGISLSNDIVVFIAEKITSNIRQLEGVVKKMKALNAFMGMPLDMDTAKRAIEDIYKENPGINPTPAYIIDAVASFYGVSAADITGSKRGQDIMLARQSAIYLTRKLTKHSLPEIGAAFGGRDHTTVIHSINKIEDLIRSNDTLKNNLNLIIKTIRQE